MNPTSGICRKTQAVLKALANHPENLKTIECMNNITCIPSTFTGKSLRFRLFRESRDVVIGEK